MSREEEEVERRVVGDELFHDHYMARGYVGGFATRLLYCASVPDPERAAALRELLELADNRAWAYALLQANRETSLRALLAQLRRLKVYPGKRPRLWIVTRNPRPRSPPDQLEPDHAQ